MESLRVKILGIITSLLALAHEAGAVIPTPIPTFDNTAAAALENAEWDFHLMLPIVINAYAAPFGASGQILVYGSIILSILVSIAIRQEDLLIPMILLAIFGQIMYWSGFIPADWGFWVIVLLYLLPAVGIGYSLYKSKR
jgi:hypothetical protein